jgi:hypothetical protein
VNVTWTTEKPTTSIIKWGTTPADPLIQAGSPDSVIVHNVRLDTLRPGKTYYFKIVIGSDEYMENGVPYSFKTPSGIGEGVTTTDSLPTEQVVPTIVVPTAGASEATSTPTEIDESKCDRVTDYNSDGVVNSLDYYYCIQSLTDPNATPTVTKTLENGECDSNNDNNGDGSINSLDTLWCLQHPSP